MVLLPVLLSLMGPSPYLSAQTSAENPSNRKISNSTSDSLSDRNDELADKFPTSMVSLPKLLPRNKLTWNDRVSEYEHRDAARATSPLKQEEVWSPQFIGGSKHIGAWHASSIGSNRYATAWHALSHNPHRYWPGIYMGSDRYMRATLYPANEFSFRNYQPTNQITNWYY